MGVAKRDIWEFGNRGGSLIPSIPPQSFNTYFSNEHSRLLTLWRQLVAFRRHFGEMKATTERSAGLGAGALPLGDP